MLGSYFVTDVGRGPLAAWGHAPWLVALSVVLAVMASIMAMHLAGLARVAVTPLGRRAVVFSGALGLGGGIWAMHFVGMLAFDLCRQGVFHPGITALSVLPALLASWVALNVLAQPYASGRSVTVSGLLVGLGIAAMHYLGMAASTLAPIMRYDVAGFLASVVFALGMAVAALHARQWLLRAQQPSRSESMPGWLADVGGGVVMGMAIAGMHYISIDAVRLVAQPAEGDHAYAGSLPIAIAAVAVGLGVLITATNGALRHRLLYRKAMADESRLRAVVQTAVDGIVTVGDDGLIQSFNRAAERMLGWREQEVLGRDAVMLMPPALQEKHEAYQQLHGRSAFGEMVGPSREVEVLHKDGALVPIRLAVGRVERPGMPLYVGFLVDLTERRALEAERRRNAEQLRSLVGNIPGVAFRSRRQPDRALVFVSDAVEALTGWSAQELVGGQMALSSLIHGEDAACVWHAVASAVAEGRPYRVEYRLVARSGAVVWVSETGRGLADDGAAVQYIDGVIVDETEVKARNAEFSGVVRALNRAQAVAEFDLNGRLLTANDNFLRLMGYTLDEVVGKRHAMFCTPDYVRDPAHAALWMRLARGELDAGEYQRVGKDGRLVWIQATYNPILDAGGRTIKIIKFATDLSERRAMEQDLRQAKDTAEQAARSRATFLANMSHEIRTPMNAIIGFTEALLDSRLDEVQRRHLSSVHHAARSMLRLLNDILDTAKLDKGAMGLECTDFSLRALCVQIMESLRIQAGSKRLDLVLDFPAEVPDFWHGDGFRVQQILLNLLGNALKFTHQGGVTLRVRHAPGQVELAVIDTGIGMDAKSAHRIFDAFSQADPSTTRRYGGTGLGTTISRQLAELMGGSIGVESVVGEGSVFTVRLPLARAQAAAQLPAQPALPVLPPLRVLAVDDVPANLQLLELLLARGGHAVTCVGSGAAALQAMAAQAFDVVLMDLQMPEMDGLEATRRLRAQERARGRVPTPVVALSASVLAQDQRNARAAGMAGFASKPVDAARLLQEVGRVLGLLPDGLTDDAVQVAAPLPDIDWLHADQTWGDAGRLRQAIERFLPQARAQAADLQLAAVQADWPMLAAAAHRLHGAAGNLAMRRVQVLAAELEQFTSAASGTEAAPPAAPLRAALDALLPALDAVEAALASFAPAAPALDAQQPPVPSSAPAAAADPLQQRSAIDALDQALAHSEIAAGALDALLALLPVRDAQRLQDAIDAFDFDAARDCLQDLRSRGEAGVGEEASA